MEHDESLSPSQLIVRDVLGSPPSNAPSEFSSTSCTPVHSPPPLNNPPNATGPAIVWFRGHDLRVHDHAALDAAIASAAPVVALYVLERGAETDGAVSYMRRLSAALTQHCQPSDNISFLSGASAPSAASSPRQNAHESSYTATSPASDDDHHERQPWGPLSPNGGFALGRVQRWYLHHSLLVLRNQLQQLSITLVLRKVDCADDTAVEVLSVARALGATSVFWNKRYKPRAYPVDEAVKSGLQTMQVIAQDFDSETLIPPSADYGTFDDFQSYARFWLNYMRLSPPSHPKPPIDANNVISLPCHVVRSLLSSSKEDLPGGKSSALPGLPGVGDLELLNGLSISGHDSPGQVSSIGCVAATRTLERFLRSDRFSRFASDSARRDGMVTGDELATSRLSPHVRFGEISPRVLFWSVVDAGSAAAARQDFGGLNAARLFIKNMSLREFGYYMLSRYPSAACKPIMPEFEVFPWEEDADGTLTSAWKNGTTGFPIVDAAMRQLIRDGWLHNRMRFLAASFFCKYLLLPWPVGAAHMVRTLVDGDEACNSLGWQWTAGCNSDSFPFSTLVNPLSLHTHTRSQSRAAQYIRKYVPELAHLPDHLVFSPWTASDEERAAYKLVLLPLRQYNQICPSSIFNQVASGEKGVFYPMRVVTGPQARYRARTAMEVMRRIFVAKKRYYPVLKDSTSPWPIDVVDGDDKKKTCVTILELKDCDELPRSSSESELSYVTTSLMPNCKTKETNIRRREEPDTALNEIPSKRPRITFSLERSQGADQLRGCESQLSKDLPVSTRPKPLYDMKGELHLENRTRSGSQMRASQLHQTTSTRKVADAMGDQRTAEIKTSSRIKRPRSPSNQPMRPATTPRTSDPYASVTATPSLPDDRLSVKSLLSPNLSSPQLRQMRLSNPRDKKYVAAELMSAMSGLPKLAQVAAIQRDAQMSHHTDLSRGALGLNSFPPPPPRISGIGEQIAEGGLKRSPASSGKTNALLSTPNTHGSVGMVKIGAKEAQQRTNQTVPNASASDSSRHQLPSRVRDDGNSRSKAIPVVSPNPQVPTHPHRNSEPNLRPNIHHSNGMGNATFSPSGTVPATMFHPNAIPLTLVGAQFQQNQAGHMLMPFTHAGGHLPVQAVPHHPGSIHNQNTQGYVSMNPVGANPHHPPGSPFTWYPTMAPYMEFRPPAVPTPVLPHMAHTFMHSGHNPIATPYQVDRRNLTPRSASQCVPGPPTPVNKSLEGSRRRGPTTPLEREGIARRMAAMDYTDDTYGGKHWEQWQAISLHLLNQYEFSEDTDRDTTRSYVRLCVLKDELRDANRNGPRVTVNHCKEVFRILNLPVTGEWDRRGHGGVRGPYVYGCMKRNSHHVSR